MNLVNLQTFLAIVETGHLVRASEQLNVTQSTVTARMKVLEQEIGQPLLHRQKSGATLTTSGHKLKRYAEVMLQLWRQARHETSLPEGMEYICNLGCHADLWPGLGKRLFQQVQIEYPDMAISGWPGEQQQLDRWLGEGLVDLALTYSTVARENQTIHTLATDQLILVSDRPDSPMKFDPLYVYVDLGEEFRKQHAAAYVDADTASVSFGSAIWAQEYISDNGGSAYLPRRLVQQQIDDQRLFLVEAAPQFERKIYLVVNERTQIDTEWVKAVLQ